MQELGKRNPPPAAMNARKFTRFSEAMFSQLDMRETDMHAAMLVA
jgi:hypothetical protein